MRPSWPSSSDTADSDLCPVLLGQSRLSLVGRVQTQSHDPVGFRAAGAGFYFSLSLKGHKGHEGQSLQPQRFLVSLVHCSHGTRGTKPARHMPGDMPAASVRSPAKGPISCAACSAQTQHVDTSEPSRRAVREQGRTCALSMGYMINAGEIFHIVGYANPARAVPGAARFAPSPIALAAHLSLRHNDNPRFDAARSSFDVRQATPRLGFLALLAIRGVVHGGRLNAPTSNTARPCPARRDRPATSAPKTKTNAPAPSYWAEKIESAMTEKAARK